MSKAPKNPEVLSEAPSEKPKNLDQLAESFKNEGLSDSEKTKEIADSMEGAEAPIVEKTREDLGLLANNLKLPEGVTIPERYANVG